jgi:hypothetical protein
MQAGHVGRRRAAMLMTVGQRRGGLRPARAKPHQAKLTVNARGEDSQRYGGADRGRDEGSWPLRFPAPSLDIGASSGLLRRGPAGGPGLDACRPPCVHRRAEGGS